MTDQDRTKVLSDYDLYLLNEGRHWRMYDRLGAHPTTIDGVEGVTFAVWAPNADYVAVVGDFNDWDCSRHPMHKYIPSGFWEIFVPEAREGALYKYYIGREGWNRERCDPVGFATEVPPRNASRVVELNRYAWNDADWIEQRAKTDWLKKPISIYEVHLGSWRKQFKPRGVWPTARDVAQELVDYVKDLGYTHIELMPMAEHPLTASWGYQVTGYFAATARYGNPEDLMALIDLCHQNGIGVIMDWVPAHFPKDEFGLARFDGTALYEHEDPRRGEHRDWGTYIFNYDRYEVRNFLIANALFWIDKYHIDGLRVDAVASMLYLDYSRKEGDWLPNEYGGRENLGAIAFLKEMNVQTHGHFPGILTIAEESTAWPAITKPTYAGGLGFSMKWNMGWMNDTLHYFKNDPLFRKYHHHELTFSQLYAWSENFILPFSHDEVVHGKGSLLGKMPGDPWQRFANLRLLLSYQIAHPGKKLMFMGSELGMWDEWNFDGELPWDLLQWDAHKGMQNLVRDLNHLMQREPAMYEKDCDPTGFEWIDCNNWDESILVFLRRSCFADNYLLVAMNFTPIPRWSYRIGVPDAAIFEEVFNSDSQSYGGSGVGNYGQSVAEPIPMHGRPASMSIHVPPLGAVFFKPKLTQK